MSSSFLRNCFGIIREVSGYCCNKQRDLILRTSKTVFLSLSNAKIKKKKKNNKKVREKITGEGTPESYKKELKIIYLTQSECFSNWLNSIWIHNSFFSSTFAIYKTTSKFQLFVVEDQLLFPPRSTFFYSACIRVFNLYFVAYFSLRFFFLK